MIRSFNDKATAAVFQGEVVRSLPIEVQPVALRKLVMIDSAKNVLDLRLPPGNRLERLQGTRQGQYSVRVNSQWRICFYFDEDGASAVEIVDYH
jgi:toxin HigB-1